MTSNLLDPPPPRSVRPNDLYHSTRRLIIGLGLVILIVIGAVAYESLGTVRRFMNEGVEVMATVQEIRSPQGKSPASTVRLIYHYAGGSHLKIIEVEASGWATGDKTRLVVLPSEPQSAWYGPLSEEDYRLRLRWTVGLAIGVFVFGILCWIGNEAELRQDLRRLSTWPAARARIETVASHGRAGVTAGIKYRLNENELDANVTLDGPQRVQDEILVLVCPTDASKVILPSEVRLADLVPGQSPPQPTAS